MDNTNPSMVGISVGWCVTGASECVSKWTRGGQCGVTAVIAQLSVAVALGKGSWNAELESGERWTAGSDAQPTSHFVCFTVPLGSPPEEMLTETFLRLEFKITFLEFLE